MRVLLILPILLLSCSANAGLMISNAWIKNLPPPVPVRAGYMALKNTGSTAITVLSVSSEAFAQIEIHRSVEIDGLMSMEAVPVLTVEANSSVQLQPGGLHLMMMQPVAPTKPGDIIRITLVLDDGSEKNLDMEVRE